MRVFPLLFCLFLLPVLAACAPQYRGGTGGQPATAIPVAEAQAGLAELGFRPGPVDGIYGPQTRAAIIAFQRARGMLETGRIDAPFADRLDRDLYNLRTARASGANDPQVEDDRLAGLPDPAEPQPEPAQTGPLPDLVYRNSGHDPALVRATGTPEDQLANVRVARVDLNNDGALDAVWNNENPQFCGAQGCSFDVYFSEGGTWRPVARLLASEVDAGTGRTGGVRDLLVTGRRGSAIWQWDGRRYVPAG